MRRVGERSELIRKVERVGKNWGELVRELGRNDKQHGASW